MSIKLKQKESDEIYSPSMDVQKHAHIRDYDSLYKKSIEKREEFWADEASKLSWYKKWNKVLDSTKKPFYKWFTGGKINIVYNAIDRHLASWRRNKLAIIWEGEPGDLRTFSYQTPSVEGFTLSSRTKRLLRQVATDHRTRRLGLINQFALILALFLLLQF